LNKRYVLALFLLEDGVAVGLVFAEEMVVVELGGKTLTFALPLGDDLALFFDLFVGVVELLLQMGSMGFLALCSQEQ